MRVAAVAGRRIDGTDAKQTRLPLSHAGEIAEKLRSAFNRNGIKTIVCSAACGTDLIAATVAAESGIRTCIVIPVGLEKFLKASVIDRPGGWENTFWTVIGRAQKEQDLTILDFSELSPIALTSTNSEILSQAMRITRDIPLAMYCSMGGAIPR